MNIDGLVATPSGTIGKIVGIWTDDDRTTIAIETEFDNIQEWNENDLTECDD